MLTLFKNLPIFRRLFLAFSLAVVIPDSIIILIGSLYTQILTRHGIDPSQTNLLFLGTILALLLSTGIVIILGYIVNITITQPLRHLAFLTKRIAQGETAVRAQITGHDEISMVAVSINNMLDTIVQLIQQTQGQRDNLEQQVDKLVNDVSGVGKGDLRIQVDVTPDSLGVLADSFNYMVEALSSLVLRVKKVAQDVESAAITTSQQMSGLVQVAQTQIQQIALSTMQVEQMAQSSYRTAEHAHILAQEAKAARLSVADGLRTVQRTIDGMERINSNVQESTSYAQILETRSHEINQIVEVISMIARNTNRLALDAAIQAEMAGEHGKGFRAVAEDIRRQAERAKEQAGLITHVVRSALADIEAATMSMQKTGSETAVGTTAVQETGTAFGKISAVVEQQAQEIETINQEMRTLLQSSDAVVHIMQGVSLATQQSSHDTRAVAQQMTRLANMAEQLLGSVRAFKQKE